MPVILVSESHRSYDDAIPQTDYGDFVAKLVFLMLLALADAEDIWFMERINLVTVQKFTVYETQTKFKMLTVLAL